MKQFLLNVAAIIYFIIIIYLTWKTLKFSWRIQPNFVNNKWSRKSKVNIAAERAGWAMGQALVVFMFLIFLGFKINLFSFNQKNNITSEASHLKDNISENADLISSLDPDFPNENTEGLIMTIISSPITLNAIEEFNQNEIELCILYLMAKRGTEFKHPRVKNWFESKPWYEIEAKKFIDTTLKNLNISDQKSIEVLLKQRNAIKNKKSDAENLVTKNDSKNAYDYILLADNYAKVKDQVSKWDLTKTCYEIDNLYANYGYVFPQEKVQQYFSQQEWYAPDPSVTIESAFDKFPPEQKAYLEILLARKKNILDIYHQTSKKSYQSIFDEDTIRSWSVQRIQEEINTVYAKYGVDFSRTKLSKWADNLRNYKPIEDRTFEQAELLFSSEDREYIKKLADRRDFLILKK